MKKIGVILSGCGVYDGSEIHEAVLTLLAISRSGAQAVCFAPDKQQVDVINHLTGEAMTETRNVLIEAAQIDGCSELFIFFKIVLPLVSPATISLTIFTFVSSWNSFIWPLVVTTERTRYTLPVALSLLATNFEKNYGLIMAGTTITFIVPFLLYCILQRRFVEGITLGGVKE